MRVGFIGLGNIGMPMALRILGAGHTLTGHTRRQDGRDELRAKGAKLTSSLTETAQNADILCVNVFDDAQLRDAMLAGGALAPMKPGSVVAIHTTGSPRMAEELQAKAPRDVSILDATFSGVAEQTLRGELTLMVGGDETALAKARPILSTYASNIFHVGPLGAGQKLKLLNNIIFGAQIKLAETLLRISAKEGLERDKVIRALMASSGGSYALNVFSRPEPVDQLMKTLSHYLDKDVAVARQTAAELGYDLGLLATATQDFGAK